jgi:hypothetical protein
MAGPVKVQVMPELDFTREGEPLPDKLGRIHADHPD